MVGGKEKLQGDLTSGMSMFFGRKRTAKNKLITVTEIATAHIPGALSSQLCLLIDLFGKTRRRGGELLENVLVKSVSLSNGLRQSEPEGRRSRKVSRCLFLASSL